jgi:hypothetical protein
MEPASAVFIGLEVVETELTITPLAWFRTAIAAAQSFRSRYN